MAKEIQLNIEELEERAAPAILTIMVNNEIVASPNVSPNVQADAANINLGAVQFTIG